MPFAAVKVRNVGITFDEVIGNTEAEIQAWIVETAKREHAIIMDTAPQPSSFKRYVDGVEGAPEESVKAGGFILYTYPRLDIVVRFAMQTLIELSPVLENVYRRSHTLLLNGHAATMESLSEFESGDEIIIANMVPYARKIEIGSMTMRVPGTDHVYQQAAKRVRAKFGNFAKVSFTFRGVIDGAAINPHYAKGTAHNKPDMRYPVLIITDL